MTAWWRRCEKDATAHTALGRIYTARGEHAPAIAELREALRLNPSLANAHYGLGIALVLVGRPEEAIAELDWAQRLSPHDPFAWLFEMARAWACILLGDFERAAEQAGRSVRRPTAAFPAWTTLASALGHLGRTAEARAALARAIELQPDFSNALFDRIWPNMEPAFLERYMAGLRRISAA